MPALRGRSPAGRRAKPTPAPAVHWILEIGKATAQYWTTRLMGLFRHIHLWKARKMSDQIEGGVSMRGTSFAAAALCVIGEFGTSAQAQTTDPAQQPSAATRQPDGADLQEVVVTGVRRSLENAINTKRVADTVVDAISAEDVGKFPT